MHDAARLEVYAIGIFKEDKAVRLVRRSRRKEVLER